MSEVRLGNLLTSEVDRDAIHVAILPVIASNRVTPGTHVGLTGREQDGVPIATQVCKKKIGIVDPFLAREVREGERYYLCLYPQTVTGMRHHWYHRDVPATLVTGPNADSVAWMRNWAQEHMLGGYYDDNDLNDPPTKEQIDRAYARAIEAGHSHSVGSHESARDYIDNEWWTHWERITGHQGDRDAYFSCSC